VFNMGSNRVLNGDPSTASTFQRPLFIGRNTLRAPRTSDFNVRYKRRSRSRLRRHRDAPSTVGLPYTDGQTSTVKRYTEGL
jgi:hypothetical protein